MNPHKEDAQLNRNRPFEAKRSCLLLIDTQNYVWNPEVAKRVPYFDRQLREVVLPNLRRLIVARQLLTPLDLERVFGLTPE